MLPRLLFAALLTLLLLAPSARAETFCVGTSCEGIAKPSLDAALTAAAASPGKDAIMLGKGPFTGAWTIAANNPVDLIGPDNDSARLVATASTGLAIANGDSTVRNLTVQTKAQDGAIGIDVTAAGPQLTRIGVFGAAGVQQQAGIVLRRGARLTTIWSGFFTAGSSGIVAAGKPESALELRQLSIVAPVAIKIDGWTQPVRISHAQLNSTHIGLFVRATGDLTADELSVFVHQPVTDLLGGTAFHAVDSTATVRNATIVARHNGATALRGENSRLTVRDSALIGGDMGFDVATDRPLELHYSALRPGRTTGPIEQPGADNVDLSRSFLGLPSFEAGIFAPAGGSALIDSGTPGSEPGMDVENRSRPLDGDMDGVARRDIGAFEANAKTSVQPGKVVLIDTAPTVVPTPVATPIVTPVATPSATPTPVATPIASPRPTAVVGTLEARTLRGRTTGAIKRVQVTLKRGKQCATKRGTVRKAKTCAWLTAKGTGRFSLTFARRLPRGTYAVKVRALDATGKPVASASKRVRRG